MKSRARSNEVLVRRLLTGTAVLTLALASSASIAGPLARDLSVVAQAQPSAGEAKPDDKDKKGRGEPRGEQRGPAARPGPPQAQPAKPPAPPKVEAPKVEPPKPAAPPAAAPRPAAPAAPPPAAPKPAAPQQQTAPKPAAPPQASPPAPAKPVAPAVQPPKEPPRAAPAAPAGPSSAPPKAETPKAAPAAPTGPSAAPPKAEAPRERTREGPRERSREGSRQAPKEEPKAETPKAAPPPTAQSPAPAPSTAQPRPAAPSTAQPQQRSAPPAANAPAAAPAAPAQVAAPPPPTTTRNANEFLLKKGERPAAPQIDAVRRERRESRDGNRTVYREPDRTIVRDGDRTFIRHNESNRFAIDARDVRSQRRDGNTVTIVDRPNGVQIVTITDDDGDLIRRVRRENGREIVIIDNSERRRHRDRDYDVFVDLPPPVIRIPRDRYIIDARRAPRDVIFGAFLAPPVMVLDRSYTLEQVRYSAPLRERMPRVDLDVNFDTGSWQLAPDQIDELAVIADGIKRAIARNPREVFMIEGYTDAVGNEIDNLSLSDRRAEAVAVALTDEFGVPPENLVTQGYGEQYLKVDTQGAERANRRVSVRRITPLIDQQATR